MYACKMMHAYEMHVLLVIPPIYTQKAGVSLVVTPPKISHTSRHCVGWHAVVCYGAPEWYRIATSLPGRPHFGSKGAVVVLPLTCRLCAVSLRLVQKQSTDAPPFFAVG